MVRRPSGPWQFNADPKHDVEGRPTDNQPRRSRPVRRLANLDTDLDTDPSRQTD
jgi:hypothetical protein